MRITASGDVGIGTAAPASFLGKLTVVGNIALATGGKTYFWDPTNSSGTYIYNPGASSVSFWKYGAGGDTELMRLVGTGRLGIGTASPAQALDVNGNIKAAQIYSAPTALTSGASIAWDANVSPIATLTLNQVGATLTMSNLIAGSTYILTITQGAGGSKTITTWTNFKWPSGVAPTL